MNLWLLYTRTHASTANKGEEASMSNMKQNVTSSAVQGPVDEVFGQRAAIPLLSEETEDDLLLRLARSYLVNVRNEATSLPSINFADLDGRRRTRHQKVTLTSSSSGTLTRYKRAWNAMLLREFLGLKQDLEKHLQAVTADSLEASEESVTATFALPSTSTEWRKMVFGHPPPPIYTLFCVIDHMTAIKLVIYFTKWVSSNMNDNLSRWVFSLFLRVDNTLNDEETSILRDFAKKAIKIRDLGTSLNQVTQFTVDMIVAIVARYYGQRDLV